ncbi:MAG: phenylacetate--CoA ligase family protein [Planctomycetota bacterium]
MNPPSWLVRHFTYPLHERLQRRPTLRVLHELATLVGQSRQAVEHLVEGRLGALLYFAAKHLPFYAERFARHGLDPATQNPRAVLARLPILDKHTVRANSEQMVWTHVPGGPIAHSSGGTTGDTLHFRIDRVRQAEPLAARLFMQSLFGIRPGDRRAHLWGSPIETSGSRLKRWRDRLLNEMLLNAFDMSPARMAQHLARLEDFRPRVLYGYPSALALLARHILAHHRRPVGWPDLVVMTGEEIIPDQSAQVRAAFRCQVASEYGSREIGLIAHDCPHGRLHLLTPLTLVEVLADNRPACPGESGDIVCTTLNTRAQPLIRYHLGDAGMLPAENCDCGLPLPLLRLTGGKITGLITLPDGRLCHGAITSHMLRDLPGIVEFKTYQRSRQYFEVFLVVNSNYEPRTPARIHSRYRALFGPQVEAACRVVERIPPDPSGKRRYVVSDVAPDRGDLTDVCDLVATGPPPEAR